MNCWAVNAYDTLMALSTVKFSTLWSADWKVATKLAAVVKRGGKSNVTVSPRFAVSFSKFLNLVLAVATKQFKFCRYAKLDNWYVCTCCKMLFGTAMSSSPINIHIHQEQT